MSNPENQTVRITRNTFVAGVPYKVGDIETFALKVCDELFSARAAEPFTPPEKAPRETATIAKPENAALPPAKKKTK